MYSKVATAYDRNPKRIAMVTRANRKRAERRMIKNALLGVPACIGMAALYLLSIIPA